MTNVLVYFDDVTNVDRLSFKNQLVCNDSIIYVQKYIKVRSILGCLYRGICFAYYKCFTKLITANFVAVNST